MITFAELATRVEQLEKRLEIIESQISNNSTNQKFYDLCALVRRNSC